jgi:hypothetical protein
MTLGTGSAEPRDVAAGATREEAAGVFGEYFDDAFFTSYDDFDAEVDLSLLRSLGLVAGDGLSAVLPRVLAGPNPGPRVLVGLTPDMPRREVVGQLLATHQSVTFARVLRVGDNVLLPLEPAGPAAGDARQSALDLLPSQAPGASTDEAVRAPSHAPENTGASATAAPSPRSGRGRLVLGLAAAATLATIVLTTIGLALGADALLMAAVLALAVSQGLMLIGLLYAVRLLRDLGQERDVDVEFRKQMRRRTNKLIRLSEESIRLQREDLVAGQKARNEVAVVRKRLMAVGTLLSRAEAARKAQPPD